MALKYLVCLLLAFPAALPAQDGAPAPENARASEVSSVRDKLMTSLFFRGELADMIISAGMAGKFVDLAGLETNAETRGALLAWIKNNPAEAAEVYLHLRGGGTAPGRAEIYKTTWELNSNFVSLIKSLNAAAGNKAAPGEELELAARRLYEGPQAEAGAAPVTAGGGRGGTDFFSGAYADMKLNKAGLGREVASAGAWLDALRGPSGKGPEGLEKEFSAALARYAAFVTAASSVKGRSVVTEEESRGLEAGRAALRFSLAAVALRSRAQDLDGIAAALAGAGGEPGLAELNSDLASLRNVLRSRAAGIEEGDVPFGGLGALARASEKEFSSLYLRYSAYNGLLALKRLRPRGFSCLYDYVMFRYLAAFFPGSPYPAAAAELLGSTAALDRALGAVGRGDMAAGLELAGENIEALARAGRTAAAASAFNRGAQFFQWGMFFRPVEYDAGSRRVFFALPEIAAGRPR